MTPSNPTATDLLDEIETLPLEWGLVLLDRALRQQLVQQRELVEHCAKRRPDTRWLVTIADGRSGTAAQSILRFAWYGAHLPTPVIGKRLVTPWGQVMTICATDYHRFGVAVEAGTDERSWLRDRGWMILTLDEDRVRAEPVRQLVTHLRAEHLHHLATVGLGGQPERRTA